MQDQASQDKKKMQDQAKSGREEDAGPGMSGQEEDARQARQIKKRRDATEQSQRRT